jgi:hypothetical protein
VRHDVVESIKNACNSIKFCVKLGEDELADSVEQRSDTRQGKAKFLFFCLIHLQRMS